MKYRYKKRSSSMKKASTSAVAYIGKKSRNKAKIKENHGASIPVNAINHLDVKRRDIRLWKMADQDTKESVDSQLLERVRTQLQFGDWESLAAIENKDIESHPDGALIALLAAAGKAQRGDLESAGELMQMSEDLGCARGRVLQIMMAGVHNSLGRAAATIGQNERAHRHFEESVLMSGITGDVKLISKARESEQLEQIGLSYILNNKTRSIASYLDKHPANTDISATVHYHTVLADLHQSLNPGLYLEIGVGRGYSLSLAKCKAIGVDPVSQERVPLGQSAKVITATSDEFFAVMAAEHLTEPPDLILLDGMPLIEYAINSFMAIETHASRHSVVIVPGVFPRTCEQATRRRTGLDWSGDIWKLVKVLNRYRPDLILLAMDVAPAGLLMIAGLDPENGSLIEHIDAIFSESQNQSQPSSDILQRTAAVSIDDHRYEMFIEEILKMKNQ